jgi:hypothetical protein
MSLIELFTDYVLNRKSLNFVKRFVSGVSLMMQN